MPLPSVVSNALTCLSGDLNPKDKAVFSGGLVSHWKEAALLLLPSHFSPLPSQLLTIAKTLEDSESDTDYEHVQKQLQEEWLKVGAVVRDFCI